MTLVTSESTKALFGAILLAQGAFKKAEKDGENTHHRNKYATLAAVWEAVHEPLHANGLLTLCYPHEFDGGGVTISTRIIHAESGEWVESSLRIALERGSAHEVGSAITYGRRYTLSALLGVVADDDDDGNAAQEGAPPKRDERPARSSGKKGEDKGPKFEPGIFPFGHSKGKKLAEVSVRSLVDGWVWAKLNKETVYVVFLDECVAELKRRAPSEEVPLVELVQELTKAYKKVEGHEAGLKLSTLKEALEARLEALRQDIEVQGVPAPAPTPAPAAGGGFDKMPAALDGPEEGQDDLPF